MRFSYPIVFISEEILQSDNAIWFAPDGNHLLYARFDDTHVQTYEMTLYGDMADKYVFNRHLKYPKVSKKV